MTSGQAPRADHDQTPGPSSSHALDNADIDVVTSHPLIQAAIAVLTVAGAVGVVVVHGDQPLQAGLLVMMVLALGVLSSIDVVQQRLPNVITLPMAAATWLVILGAALIQDRFVDGLAAVGVGLAFSVMLFVFRFGMGDVKLALSVGAVAMWLGRDALVATMLAVSVGGAIAALVLMAVHRSRSLTFGYGPFLALGSVVGMLVS